MTHLGSNGMDRTEKRDAVLAMKAEGKSVADIAKATGLSKPTIYNYVKAETKSEAKVRKPQTTILSLMPTKDGAFLVSVPAHLVADVLAVLSKKVAM